MSKGYLYTNASGRVVSGTAALLHVVKEDGGLPNHYARMHAKMSAAEAAIADRNLELNSPILRAIREGRTA